MSSSIRFSIVQKCLNNIEYCNHDHGLSLHLFRSLLISLSFQCRGLVIYFADFISEYVIFLDGIINDIFIFPFAIVYC